MKTKAFIDYYKGHKILAVWNVDAAGNRSGRAPVVSLGLRKAAALLEHSQDLKDFVAADKPEEKESVKVPTDIKDVF